MEANKTTYSFIPLIKRLKVKHDYYPEQIQVSRQTISAIESNKYIPTTPLTLTIAVFKKQPMSCYLWNQKTDDKPEKDKLIDLHNQGQLI